MVNDWITAHCPAEGIGDFREDCPEDCPVRDTCRVLTCRRRRAAARDRRAKRPCGCRKRVTSG